ncbi:TPA: lipid II flippase MurJ, partial [Klebsiella pneumoniae]
GEPLIAALFQYGKFTAVDAQMTGQALMAYAVGLLALILVKILAPGFYARQDIRTPVRIAVFSLLATQLMNALFVLVLDLRHTGLALSISLAACLNAGLLYWKLRQRRLYQPQPGWVGFLLRVLLAVALMVAVLLWLQAALPAWGEGGMLRRLLALALLVAGGAGAYFAALALLGFRPRDFVRRLRH